LVLVLNAIPCFAQPSAPLAAAAVSWSGATGGGSVPVVLSPLLAGDGERDAPEVTANNNRIDGGFTGIDAQAFGEMVFGSKGRPLRWTHAPELVILMAVMEYQPGDSSAYAATPAQLTDGEANRLADDLTSALSLMTGGVFATFSGIRREFITAGAAAQVLRQGQIVVGRFRGVNDRGHAIGLGGRAARADGTIISSAMMLDADYDRASDKRWLLRAHELGHALGYNHVAARASIMNAHIGAELTDFDRQVAAVTFRRVRAIASDPTPMPSGR
jgi:hypothetical protein